MIDAHNREPQHAVATMMFYGAGQFFKWLGVGGSVQDINTVLSTISFLVSITVGIITIVKTLQKWRQK